MRTQQPLLKSHRCPVWLRALLSLVLGAMLLAAGAAHAQGSSDTITYIHTDIGGSPLAATDANGTVVWKESYRGYGQRWLYQGSSASQPQWFHGKEQDAATGWQYFGARYYDPAVGRFMGIDPVDFQDGNLHSFNRYAYGNNNPVRYLDPDGGYAEVALEALSLAVGIDSLRQNIGAGKYGAAAVDGVGVALDAVLTAIPGAPGAVGLGIKAFRQSGEVAAKGIINPSTVRFSQDSAKAAFSKGGSIQEMADALRSGALKADQIPAIRLVEKDGKLFTLDNRRLEAFRRAEMDVPYRMATPQEAAREGWKFTTRNDGVTIRIRGE